MRTNRLILIGAVMVMTFVPTKGRAQTLRAEPLKAITHTEFIKKATESIARRQDVERFAFTKTANAAGWVPLDITKKCNINLFAGKGPSCPVKFSFMPLGRQQFYGVPFDIVNPAENSGRSAIALASKMLRRKGFTNMVVIPVEAKLACVYMLLTAYYAVPGGKQFMRLNYADGTEYVLPIKAKGNIDDWYHANTRIYSDTAKAVVIPAVKGSTSQFRNMHVLEGVNPSPDKLIKSVTFKTDPSGQMVIFVVALTGYTIK